MNNPPEEQPAPLESYQDMYRRLQKELLPYVQERHRRSALKKDQRRLLLRQIAHQAIASTIGTAIGGGILVLIGHGVGLLKGLETSQVIVMASLLAVVLGGTAWIARPREQTPEQEAAEMAARLVALDVEIDVLTHRHRPD